MSEHLHAEHVEGCSRCDLSRDEVDLINHPPHYTSNPAGVECIDVVEHLSFNRGNAIKYLWRAGAKGAKGDEVEDLKKARWYVDREIQRLGQARS